MYRSAITPTENTIRIIFIRCSIVPSLFFNLYSRGAALQNDLARKLAGGNIVFSLRFTVSSRNSQFSTFNKTKETAWLSSGQYIKKVCRHIGIVKLFVYVLFAVLYVNVISKRWYIIFSFIYLGVKMNYFWIGCP